jgi:hypothetical protein
LFKTFSRNARQPEALHGHVAGAPSVAGFSKGRSILSFVLAQPHAMIANTSAAMRFLMSSSD